MAGVKGRSGRPRKALQDNLLDGNPGKRPLMVLNDNFKNTDVVVPDYVTETPGAEELFMQAVTWLRNCDCLQYVYPGLIAEYAVCKSRWKSICARNTKNGLDRNSAKVELDYLKAVNAVWREIWTVVEKNSLKEYKPGNPNADGMEAILAE